MFNVIVRHTNTQALSTYMTRMYMPVKIKCLKIVSIKQSATGENMVFILLFPYFPPKPAHLMIIVLHLPTMKLRNFREDIELTDIEFKEMQELKSTLIADITQVYGPTGSDYLFITLSGKLMCISLSTGSTVVRINTKHKDPLYRGLILEEKDFGMSKTHQVSCLGNLGSLYAVYYDRGSTTMKILRLEDRNTHEDSRDIQKACQNRENYKATSSELRINPVQWVVGDMKHKEVEMTAMYLSLIGYQGELSEEQKQRDKAGLYLAVEDKVNRKGLLKDV